MSTTASATISLGSAFATEFAELGIPWQSEEAPEPRMLVLNEPLAGKLGLDPSALRTPEGVRFLTGNAVPDGANPVAQAYAGHQFGGYSPRLGDGRALLLGEITVGDELLDLHLKGSGRTPFARGGDGLAAIGPMLREYIISEAMHALGIPTTRSLAVIATGRTVQREMPFPGAVLARVARSHLRVGTFQYARSTGDTELLRRLADHAIARHHPDAASADHPHLALYRAVMSAQASLVAKWMLVGFIHGVMNTDNMTISGETIDYGPCAFMGAYDPATVYSSIDRQGRYAYGNQPAIAEWNLARLAEAMLPLFHDDEETAIGLATEALGSFREQYRAAWESGMAAKLGVPVGEAAATVAADLRGILSEHRVEFTSFFRRLSAAARGDVGPARELFLEPSPFDDWVERWRMLDPDPSAMDRANPLYIPRNHLVEEALAAATDGDLGPFERLVDAVTSPFDERPGLERYAAPGADDFGLYQTFCGT